MVVPLRTRQEENKDHPNRAMTLPGLHRIRYARASSGHLSFFSSILSPGVFLSRQKQEQQQQCCHSSSMGLSGKGQGRRRRQRNARVALSHYQESVASGADATNDSQGGTSNVKRRRKAAADKAFSQDADMQYMSRSMKRLVAAMNPAPPAADVAASVSHSNRVTTVVAASASDASGKGDDNHDGDNNNRTKKKKKKTTDELTVPAGDRTSLKDSETSNRRATATPPQMRAPKNKDSDEQFAELMGKVTQSRRKMKQKEYMHKRKMVASNRKRGGRGERRVEEDGVHENTGRRKTTSFLDVAESPPMLTSAPRGAEKAAKRRRDNNLQSRKDKASAAALTGQGEGEEENRKSIIDAYRLLKARRLAQKAGESAQPEDEDG